MASQLRIGIIGATGYTGEELVRLLLNHPRITITTLTSEQQAGTAYAVACPQFRGQLDLILEPLNVSSIAKRIDLAFLCLPHHASAKTAADFLKRGVRVIDLSADFRLRDRAVYETWYGPHPVPALLKSAVYAIPELLKNVKIVLKKTSLIANPGCYPTSIALGLAPLLKAGWIDTDHIICDSKSGTTGAGRGAAAERLFCEVNENFYAYKVASHRHTPEIEQMLSDIAEKPITVQFTPHLLPIDRGILSTIYARATNACKPNEIHALFDSFYRGKPFVRVLPNGTYPQIKHVVRSNYCDIGATYDARTNNVIVVSAIDNLTKGASGQAIQNMNLMLGWKETLGF